MNRRVLLAAFCLPWFALVFLVSWLVTFPGEAVVDRIGFEVSKASGGRSVFESQDVGPWWFGLSASKVRLYEVDPRNLDLPSTLKYAADDVRASLSLFGLLRGNRDMTGSVTSGESTVEIAFSWHNDEGRNKGWTATRLWVSAPGARLEDLALLSALPLLGSGTLDVSVDVSGEEGMRTATGTASVIGKDLVLTEITYEGSNVLTLAGMEQVVVEVLDLDLEIKEGRARVSKGAISSALFDAEISGDITLRDEVLRSNVRLTAVLEPRGEAEKFAAFAGDAKWADGKLHFVCTGYLSAPACRPERENRRGAARAGTPATATTPGTTAVEGEDDRARRREEARERVRRRREEREGRTGVPAGEEPTAIEEEDPLPPEDEEPVIEEELPLDDNADE